MNRVKPKTLPGFMELLPEDQILFNKMCDTIKNVYERFGFVPIDTPVLEYSEILLAKAGGETEKQIYRFSKGDNDISLRFDLTVPLARYTAEHYDQLIFPFKRYQISKVYRGERPQKGRFREFYQCDIDIIGNEKLDTIYEAEVPAVIYTVFRELDIGKFTIRINNRKILNGFFETLHTDVDVSEILRIIDKIDKIGIESMKKELLHLNIQEEEVMKILNFIQIQGSTQDVLDALQNLNGGETLKQGIKELCDVIQNLKKFGVDDAYYKIDLTIARGLDYYTGTVYETILDEYPKLGSICSGGRYDNLSEYYTDKVLPGVGISIGLTRLFSKLKEMGILQRKEKSLIKVLVIPFDEMRKSYALEVIKELRKAGIASDIYLQDRGFKQKLKYANRIGVPYVVILGEDEENKNEVTLKNMETGEQDSICLSKLLQMFMSEK